MLVTKFTVLMIAAFAAIVVAAVVPFGAQELCAGAACEPECECRIKNCDVPTCLSDEDCRRAFTCSTPKCSCSSGDSACIKTCLGHPPSAATNATLACFLKKCPPSSFMFLPKSITNSSGGGPCFRDRYRDRCWKQCCGCCLP